MRNLYVFVVVFLNIACESPKSIHVKQNVDTTQLRPKCEIINQLSLKNMILNYPVIKDSICFKTKLIEDYDLFVGGKRIDQTDINYFKKINVCKGNDSSYYLLEFDYHDWSMASHPWKYQLLFNHKAELIKIFYADSLKMLKVFDNEAPMIVEISSTAKGNGAYSFYQFEGDSLINIFKGFSEYLPRLVDEHQDHTVNEPAALNYVAIDVNCDGFRDLYFFGKLVLIEEYVPEIGWIGGYTQNDISVKYSIDNPYKKIPIEYVFLYDPKLNRFIEKENYFEKYKSLFGE